MFALTRYHDEERSHDGVWLMAVSTEPLALAELARQESDERLQDQLEDTPIAALAPTALLQWADGVAFDGNFRYEIKQVHVA